MFSPSKDLFISSFEGVVILWTCIIIMVMLIHTINQVNCDPKDGQFQAHDCY